MARYRFTLNNGTENRICYPRWKSDTALEFAFESNQMFRRATLSSAITFVGSDYDWLMATGFEQKISVTISVDWAENGTYVAYWSGKFYKTDCTINVDNKTIKVKPDVEDRYNKILAGLDKEYDLIKLLPAIQPVTTIRRPLLQIYSAGEDIVSCFLSGMNWEQDVVEETDSAGALVGDYHFGRIGQYAEVGFASNPYFTEPFIGTVVTRPLGVSGEWNDYGSNGNYYMTYFQYEEYNGNDIVCYNGLRIYILGTQTKVWEFIQTDTMGYADIPDTFTMVAKQQGYNNLNASYYKTTIYGRWLTATQQQGGYELPTSDLVEYNRNYKYCVPFSGQDSVVMTYNTSNTPTEWGVRSDGLYFAKPAAQANVLNYFPIARTKWVNGSLWYAQTTLTEAMEESYRVETALRDAYTLEAVITALLSQIDNTISFEGTAVYSQFLYGRNPFVGVSGGTWGRLVMTPKSNIKVAEYNQPAQKAPITLNQVLKMLKDACGCYWYINASNQLCIEQISWFKNGGSYSGTQAIGVDVTAATNTRNGKSLAFGTNEYSYDKIDMPQRFQYEWEDTTTEYFKGAAIEVVSTFVQEDKIEEVTIAGFNSDLDYIMLNPNDVSDDGFALMCCSVTDGVYKTTIDEMVVSGVQTAKMQNGRLAFVALQPMFLISDMPSWNIKVNGAQTTAKGIQRKKQQQLEIPIGSVEPNMQLLVQTGIGVGEIKTMSIRLTSRMAKTTLVYDTTQQ